ncbi:MAG TPA: hypothetical protein DCP02_02110 [Actinobacteria bacterium]|nr:hypothetical protein [Actinomycetota bacterium]
MATRTINLLPKEEKKRDVKSAVFNVLMIVVIILFIAVMLLSIFIFDIDKALSLRLGEYENVNIKTRDQVNKLKVYNDFSNEVEKKQDIIDIVKKDEIIWSKILYDIGKFMPEGAYIKTFTAQGTELYTFLDEYKMGEEEDDKQVISFSINGDALKYTEVLKLVIELKKIEHIEQVWIQNIININSPEMNADIINFTINTFWGTEYFIEKIDQGNDSPDESVLDMELEELES